MPGISIKSDGRLEQFVKNLGEASQWMPTLIEQTLKPLGERIVKIMQAKVRENRYTGALEDSITSEYESGESRVVISPKAMRGRWDAGLILELGTKPIPNAPYGPIKKWADFRGLPAFPVWYKIRTQGVSAHPFLERTLDASESEIGQAAQELVDKMAEKVLPNG